MKTLRVRIYENDFLQDFTDRYYQMPRKQLIETFLPKTFKYEIVPIEEKADICLCGIQTDQYTNLRSDEINYMICVENCPKWKHYKHYNIYSDFGDNRIQLYSYNHHSKPILTDMFLSIPTIFFRLNYYLQVNSFYKSHPSLQTKFSDKKFALITNKSALNKDIYKFASKIKHIGKIDHIGMHDDKVLHASCYNSIELLQIYNQYKFIFCFENSYQPGYITEKIFNGLLSNSIPIYCGAPDISEFIDTSGFINIHPTSIDIFDSTSIAELVSDETKYNELLNKNKVNIQAAAIATLGMQKIAEKLAF
jgi:hypothetical protein